jgi:hypothetical protein
MQHATAPHNIIMRDCLTFRSLESLVHTCSSVLWGMVEHFPAFEGKRDAFDMIASKTLADLATNNQADPGKGERLSTQENISTGESSDRREDVRKPSYAVQDEALQLLSQADQATQLPLAATNTGQHPQVLQSTTVDVLNTYTPSDFGQLFFDWEGLENMNGFFTPT